MPITMNSFKCSNGHSFEANAKLRTRCPSCGVMTKRSFVTAILTPENDDPKLEPKVEPKPKVEPVKIPVLIRQGRPRMAAKKAAAAPKHPEPKMRKPKGRTLIGSKVSAGLVSRKTIRTRGVMPTIKRRPIKTAVARGIQGHEQVKPYWHDVADKYGF